MLMWKCCVRISLLKSFVSSWCYFLSLCLLFFVTDKVSMTSHLGATCVSSGSEFFTFRTQLLHSVNDSHQKWCPVRIMTCITCILKMTQMCSETTLSLLKTVCKDYYSSLDKLQGFVILPPLPPPLSLWGYVTGLNPNPGSNPKH